MKSCFLFLFVNILIFHLSAQESFDKLYLYDEIRDVSIEEVGTNIIRFRYPTENAIYSISKNQVKKIRFASGREEKLNSSFKPVKSLDDYKKVYITYVPQDVEGLETKGEVFSKATGVTTLSSINNVNNRAVKKIKMEAAMLGANVVFIGNTSQRGNQYGNEFTPGNSTMTSLAGTAYSSIENRESLEVMQKRLENYRYHFYQENRLNRNAWNSKRRETSKYDSQGNMVLMRFDKVFANEGELFVKTKEIKSKTPLKVIRADEEILILMKRDGKTVYNYFFLSEKEPRIAKTLEIMKYREVRK